MILHSPARERKPFLDPTHPTVLHLFPPVLCVGLGGGLELSAPSHREHASSRDGIRR
jgi:hypothetical protein